jgi:WhiB family transcriptional regulator, redox-sensing transcriptional regulator
LPRRVSTAAISLRARICGIFYLKERIPHLPGARCRGHSELFDERPADDPAWHAVTERALAACASCPALGPCEEWLRKLDPPERPRGVVAGRIIKSRGVITKDRKMRVRL